MSKHTMDARWKHPFTSLIAGPTGSGKTVFVNKFVSHLSDMVDPIPEEILYCYGEWQSIFDTMKGVQFVEGLPDMDQIKNADDL